MLSLRLAKSILLWLGAAALWELAWLRTANASSLDQRLPWGLPILLGALLLGLCLARLESRRTGRGLGSDAHALLLLVTALAAIAWAHVAPQTSIQVLREEIPPLFAWVGPALVALLPPILVRTRARLDLADQALSLTLFLFPLSGALLLLEGPAALCLAGATLALSLHAAGGRLPRAPVLLTFALVTGLMLLSAEVGLDRLQSRSATPWILAHSALTLSLACRQRSTADWRVLLSMPVLGLSLIAVCGVLLTGLLAIEVDLGPALRTRLTLFRQHPNFLAPAFAFGAVLASGLCISGRSGRVLAGFSALLLAGATWHTDSRAGLALLVLGVLGIPALALIQRLLGERTARLVPALVVAVPILALLLGLALPDAFTAGIDRFEKSMDYRLDAWRNSLALVRQHPWLGIGPHTFLSVERFAPGSRFFNAPESPHPHNVLLYVAQSAGWPALVLFLGWLGLLLRGLLKPAAEGRSPLLPLTLASALLALLIANLLDVGLAIDTVIPEPVFLATGLVAALAARGDRQDLRPAWGFLTALALGAVVLGQGLRPVAAASAFERAELLASQAARRTESRDAIMVRAREEARRAIDLDRELVPAYELLSRWLESTEGGLSAAREVLLSLLERAPQHGRTSSLLGHLYLRARLDEEAVAALRASLADSHGSVHQTRDRAQLVLALARLGRRDEARETLVDALRLDVGVIDALTWRAGDAADSKRLVVGRTQDNLQPLALLDALEMLFGQYVSHREAGGEVGRRAWMDLVTAFRRAGHDGRALAVLDDLEQNAPEVEPHSIVHERGQIALDAGDGATALVHFELALAMTGNPFFATQATRARRLLGEAAQRPGQGETALAASGEILDQPTAFRDNLLARAATAESAGNAGAAAELMEQTLLYEDDPLARASLLLHVAELLGQAGRPEDCTRAVHDAMHSLSAKPYPTSMLQQGMYESLPGKLAVIANMAWSMAGLDASQRQQRAWGIPGFFDSSAASALFRTTFFSENGQPDAVLRNAELQLLADERNLLARWSRLDALEAMGRHAEALQAMRDIAEQVREDSPVSLERLFAQVVERGMARLDDGQAWFEAGLVRLLQGRYREAADLMGNARNLHRGDDRSLARLMGWQARAELFSGSPAALPSSRALLREAAGLAPEVGSLRRRLETLP